MKKFLKNISAKLKNSLNLINREKLEEIIPYLLPEFWASNKKSFLLFWFIGLFTIIFLVWASIAEVNQVVRAPGTVIPDSKVHLVQSGIAGPVEKINVKLDDEVNAVQRAVKSNVSSMINSLFSMPSNNHSGMLFNNKA